jgi:hypothetical protein
VAEQRSPPYRNRALLDLAHNVRAAGELLASNVTTAQCAAYFQPRAKESCYQVADYYYLGVKYGGADAYSDAQKAAGKR